MHALFGAICVALVGVTMSSLVEIEMLSALRDKRADPPLVLAYLRQGADPNALDWSKRSSLMYVADYDPLLKYSYGKGDRAEETFGSSVSYSSVEIAEMLISAGANVNTVDLTGTTALLLACQRGNLGVVRLLLEAGADVLMPRIDGTMPLKVALDGGWSDIASELRAALAKLSDSREAKANQPEMIPVYAQLSNELKTSAGACDSVSVQRLIAAGASVDVRDHNLFTPLLLSVVSYGSDVNGDDVALRDADDRSGMVFRKNAAEKSVMHDNCERSIRLLISAGASLNMFESNGWTSLMFAADEVGV